MGKTITVTISDGKALVATQGFSGGECLKETEALKGALGTTTSTRMLPEGRVSATQRVTVGGSK